jgi:hypothetical protein
MPKTPTADEMFKRLHAQGLRKRTAKLLSEAADGRRKPQRAVRQTLSDLGKLITEAEDRISGGPAKRQATAKKAAATRKRKAARRSASAKQAARTRASRSS